MTDRKWDNPIDSRFIFKLLMDITNLRNKSKLYKMLLLDSNEGQAFAGTNGRVKHCWWPDHVNWFYIALSFFNGDDTDLYSEDQKFPLEKDLRRWNEIAVGLNGKDESKEESNRLDIRYTRDQIEHQLTFESHVYHVLKGLFDKSSLLSNEDKKDFIIDVCEKSWIPQYEISRICELEKIEDILEYIILRAKDALGSPLTVPIASNAASESTGEKQWRILSANELDMDPMDISAKIMENDRALYRDLPESALGNQQQWADIFVSFPSFCKFLVDPKEEIHGNFTAVGLTREQERKMQQGRLNDAQIDVSFCDPLHNPGEHVLYLLNLSVNRDVEIDKYYALWDELIALLKKCADEGIYFTKIYYKAFLPEHRAMVIGRGFRFVCYDAEYGAVFVHEMNPASTLRILNEELAALYRERKTRKRRMTSVPHDELEAEDGFQTMFRLIDALFRHPRLAELKPYFFSNIGLPEDEYMRQLGIAAAETLRDILQYSKSLLEYLNENYARTYEDYAGMIMESALVKAGMAQYRFATEHPDFNVKRLGIDQVNARDIVNYAMIWIDLDKLFMMRDDILKLRPYFYELSDSLPKEEEMPAATALVVRLLSSMKISESLLDRVPNHFVISYYKYKEMVASTKIVQKVIEQVPFLKDELNW